MEFDRLTEQDLDEFLTQDYHEAINPELSKVEQAEQLWNQVRDMDVIFPFPIVDLYVASTYMGPTDVTYTSDQIMNLTPDQIQQFVKLFHLDPNTSDEINRTRILRILEFLGLIISSEIIFQQTVLSQICENLSPEELTRFKEVNPLARQCLEEGALGEQVKQKIYQVACGKLNPLGAIFLDFDSEFSLSLTIGGETTLDEVSILGTDEYFDSHGRFPKLMDQPNREEILDTPLVSCPEIEIYFPTIAEEEGDVFYGPPTKVVTISASDGKVVRIRDFLNKWVQNNREIVDQIPEGEYIDNYFGNHIYFEGLNHIDGTLNRYDIDYGS